VRCHLFNLLVVLKTGYSDATKGVPPNLRILRKPFEADTLRDFIDDIVRPGLTQHLQPEFFRV
jgi:hypothetical protein